MSKRDINTELGIPKGASYQSEVVRIKNVTSSLPVETNSEGFALTLRIDAGRKFSFSYNVEKAQKKRANLLANGRHNRVSSEQE